MIEIGDKKKCCGCEGCQQICPQKCITLEYDNEGFIYPKVELGKCIKCKLCIKVCPMGDKNKIENIIKVYAAYDKSTENLLKSSSGGIFGIIAEKFIAKKGIVFGAAFNKDFKVEHIDIKEKKDLDKLRGSKYVQSSINKTYINAKKKLEENKLVLFSGTPCQIEGLKKFLGNKKYDNLFTIAIICHGVPSPKVFEKYLLYLKNKYKSEIKNIEFRKKINKWNDSYFYVNFQNEKTYSIELGKEPYVNSFLCDLYLRPSCHECQFKNIPSNSDIILGDFWGIENEIFEMYNEKGVSAIIANSRKGQELIEEIKKNIIIKECKIENILKRNPCLVSSPKEHKKRKEFMESFNEENFEYVIKKYMKNTIETYPKKIKRKIFKIFKIK